MFENDFPVRDILLFHVYCILKVILKSIAYTDITVRVHITSGSAYTSHNAIISTWRLLKQINRFVLLVRVGHTPINTSKYSLVSWIHLSGIKNNALKTNNPSLVENNRNSTNNLLQSCLSSQWLYSEWNKYSQNTVTSSNLTNYFAFPLEDIVRLRYM